MLHVHCIKLISKSSGAGGCCFVCCFNGTLQNLKRRTCRHVSASTRCTLSCRYCHVDRGEMSTIPSKICINKNRVVVLEEKCSMPTYRLCTQCPSGALLTCHRPISDAADFWYRARAPLILVASEYMSDTLGALMFPTAGVDSYASESVAES